MAIVLLLAVLLCVWLWFTLFHREKCKPTGSKPTVDPKSRSRLAHPRNGDTDWETLVAVHEAGHALVALRCSLVSEVERIKVWRGEGSYRGQVTYLITERNINSQCCHLVITLAGIAAEMMVYGCFRSGHSQQDLTQARTLVRGVTQAGLPAWRVDVRYPLDFASMFDSSDPLTKAEAEALQFAYDVARNLLERSVAQHGRLTAMILSHREIGAAAIVNWFGDRSMLRVVGLVRGCFV